MELLAFGIRSTDPEAYTPGESVDLGDGVTLTVDEDGRYEMRSPIPFDISRGRRFYYQAAVPPKFSLANYEEILGTEGVDQSFINTFTVTIPATIIPIAIAAFAAYAFSWIEFPGRKLLFALVVGLLVVPLQMSLIPLLRMYNQVSNVLPFFEAKSYAGIWLAHTGFGLPLAIFLLRNYIAGLPKEIIESARIDGASHFQTFIRLILPLSMPALASFAIFQFLWVWNDLLVALVFLSKDPDQIVMTSQLRELLGSRGDNWEILTSSAFVSILVPLAGVFRAAALLRARPAGGFGEGWLSDGSGQVPGREAEMNAELKAPQDLLGGKIRAVMTDSLRPAGTAATGCPSARQMRGETSC